MAISSTPTPPPRPLGRRTFRGTSPPPTDAGDRSFRLQILRASKPSRSSKLDPSDDRRRVLYAPTPVVALTAEVTKSQPLVSLDATENSTHHRSSQHHLQQTSGHGQGNARARSPTLLPKREPDENRVQFPPGPLAAASISRQRLLENARANDLQLHLASRSGGDHRSSQHQLPPTSGHSLDDARARSPVVLPKKEPDEDRVWFPPHPLAAMPIARRRLLGNAGADNLQLPLASRSGGNTATRSSTAQTLDATSGSQPHIQNDGTGHTTYRRIVSRHHFTWYARPRRDDTPEAVVKSEPGEDLTPLVARPPNVASTSQLPSGDTARAHNSEVPFSPECKEEIPDLPKANPSLKHGGIVSRDGNPEIPPLVVSRRVTTNERNTGAPTASPSHPRVPSLSTVTQHVSTKDSFSALFPWAKYSVELNRPTNVPLHSSLPPAIKRESTPVLVTEDEDFDASDEASGSDSESDSETIESERGSKRTRDEASDDNDESVEDVEVEEQRPLRRRKLLWVD